MRQDHPETHPAPCGEAALLAEQALATDWLHPDENAAWKHLGPDATKEQQS